jgi:hypothetical protein
LCWAKDGPGSRRARHRMPVDVVRARGRRDAAAWTEGFGTKSRTAAGDGADCRRLTEPKNPSCSCGRGNTEKVRATKKVGPLVTSEFSQLLERDTDIDQDRVFFYFDFF